MSYEETNRLQTWSETDSFTIERYRQFCGHIGNPLATLLDVGCNTGRGGATLKSTMPLSKVYGLDVVEQRVNKITRGIYEKLIYGSLTNIETSYNNMFDYVIAGEVIEHIAPGEMEVFIKSIYRILKPGGTVLLTTPNPNALLVRLGRTAVYKDPSHLSIMNSKLLSGILERVAFKNIKIFGSGKSTRYLTENIPLLFLFGSYLIKATK